METIQDGRWKRFGNCGEFPIVQGPAWSMAPTLSDILMYRHLFQYEQSLTTGKAHRESCVQPAESKNSGMRARSTELWDHPDWIIAGIRPRKWDKTWQNHPYAALPTWGHSLINALPLPLPVSLKSNIKHVMYATQSWHSQFYREPFPIRSNSSPQKALGHLYQDLMHYAPLHIMFYKWGIWAIFPFPRDNQPEVTILLGLYSANNAHSHTCCCQKNISSAA